MPVRQDLALCFDLETTGGHETDPGAQILEFGGVLVSIPDLEVVDDFQASTWFNKNYIKELDPVVQEMHTKNCLWDACLMSPWNEKQLEAAIVEWLSGYSKKSDLIPMMGSGVAHYDGKWIQARMPDLRKRLTYWAFDVGSVRRFLTMIAGREIPQIDNKPGEEHRALPDAYRALEEARAYKRMVSAAGIEYSVLSAEGASWGTLQTRTHAEEHREWCTGRAEAKDLPFSLAQRAVGTWEPVA